MFVAILEDNADRQAAMESCFRDRFPQYPIRFFASAVEMIWHLQRHLSEAIAISLDHDFELVQVSSREFLDGGTGRHVADYLAGEVPVCPIVIHSTNTAAADGMELTLQDAGWITSRVTPYGDLEWVPEAWMPAIRNAIVGSVPVSNPEPVP
jgi:hypothetical protein